MLHGIDFSVAPGEIVALLGRNGMGKSTLMKSLIGLMPAKSGEIRLNDTNLTPLESHKRVAKGVAYVPQGCMIFSAMTVEENIETGLFVRGKKQVPQHLYEMFPVLQEMRKRRGGNLSGGQQQQLAIARALATEPSVLLLDEPTEGIQPSIILELGRTLKRIRDERNLSIVVSEQVLKFALDIADHILVIEGGRIVHEAGHAIRRPRPVWPARSSRPPTNGATTTRRYSNMRWSRWAVPSTRLARRICSATRTTPTIWAARRAWATTRPAAW